MESRGGGGRTGAPKTAGGGERTEENAERLRQLRAKRERLAYTVERLNLQKTQKVSCIRDIRYERMLTMEQHRQLRMSMYQAGSM